MPAVVFGPDRVIGRGRPRTALVLGAGGVLGAAWMTGALVRLHERLPAADVDLIVGTSAGSVLAAALRCRTSLDEIVAWQAGDITGRLSESMVLAEQDDESQGGRRDFGTESMALIDAQPRVGGAGAADGDLSDRRRGGL